VRPEAGSRPWGPWAGRRPGTVRSGSVPGESSRCWSADRVSSAGAAAPAQDTVAGIGEAPPAAGAGRAADTAAGIAVPARTAVAGSEAPPAEAWPPWAVAGPPGEAQVATGRGPGQRERHRRRSGPWTTRIPCRTCLRARDGFRNWGRASGYEWRTTINRLLPSLPGVRSRSYTVRSPLRHRRPTAR